MRQWQASYKASGSEESRRHQTVSTDGWTEGKISKKYPEFLVLLSIVIVKKVAVEGNSPLFSLPENAHHCSRENKL